VPAFHNSTLLQRHNAGQFDEAAHEFQRWVHSAGAIDARLMERRGIEQHWYLNGPTGPTATV
jgi:GH24 family phage-related lysozyme (muramidase)